MIMTGAFYRRIDNPERIVQLIQWDDHVVIIKNVAPAIEGVEEMPFTFNYFICNYELDG